MKTRLLIRILATSNTVAALTGFLIALSPLTAGAADPDVQQLRERIEQLQREAREMKAEGKPERAEILMRQAEELRDQAAKQQRVGEGDQLRPQELKRELARARAELGELRAAGKQAEVNKLQRHIEELQTALNRFQKTPDGRARPLREPASPGDNQEPGQPEMQRLRHLQAAIDNLHAAGMHEPAERLAREAQAMRQNLRQGQEPPRVSGRPDQELDQLRAEIRELRQAVRELRARLDEIARERR